MPRLFSAFPGSALPGVLALLLSSSPAAAQQRADVVLTDFTPAGFEEFQVAQDLGNLARLALEDAGLVVISGDALVDLVGQDAESCADEPACPGILWGRLPAPVLLVGRVESDGGVYRVTVQVWDQGAPDPSRIYEDWVSPSGAHELLSRIAQGLVPEPPPEPVVTRVSPGVVEERYEPIVARSDPREEQEEERRERQDVEEELEAIRDEDLDRLRLPRYALRAFEDSGLVAEDWLERARVRTPGPFVELHGGLVMGDLDRRFDTRLSLYEELGDVYTTRDIYAYETFLNGRGFTGGAAVGYRLAWWIDLSVLGGVQLGKKELTTGWETWEAGGGDNGQDLLLDQQEDVWAPVGAVLGELQPRLRIYPLATGPVKPYGLVALDLRFYDRYVVPDGEIVTYPEPTGGVTLAPSLGGGLAIDAGKGAYGFFELPWSYVVSPSGPETSGGTGLSVIPVQFHGVGQYLQFKAGAGLAF